MKKKTLLGLAILSMVGAGCATGWHSITKEDVAQSDVSLVYGYIDMSDAPSPMDYFSVKQTAPSDGGEYDFGVQNGLFIYQAMPPGTYQLDEFGGTSVSRFLIFTLDSTLHRYSFMNPDMINPDLGKKSDLSAHEEFKIDKPGLYYLGSYKFIRLKKDEDDFDLKPLGNPGEGQVLQMVLEMPNVRDTKWEALVLQRMKHYGVEPVKN